MPCNYTCSFHIPPHFGRACVRVNTDFQFTWTYMYTHIWAGRTMSTCVCWCLCAIVFPRSSGPSGTVCFCDPARVCSQLLFLGHDPEPPVFVLPSLRLMSTEIWWKSNALFWTFCQKRVGDNNDIVNFCTVTYVRLDLLPVLGGLWEQCHATHQDFIISSGNTFI